MNHLEIIMGDEFKGAVLILLKNPEREQLTCVHFLRKIYNLHVFNNTKTQKKML